MANKVEYLLTAKDQASQEFNDVSDAMGKLKKHGEGFGSVMRDAFGFDFGAADIVRMSFDVGRELNALGQEANIMEANFDNLAAEVGGATLVLDKMRSATGGVVDNMGLMTAANSLLLTGVAKSADDLAQMTAGAIKLGGAMGQDAQQSIENFNAAMLNMSYERLDTLGVSASAVRDRVKELNAAGMATDEAFQVATLEQMEISLGRLGDAADASATAFQRVTTRFSNFRTEMGKVANRGVESGAMLIEIAFVLAENRRDTQQAEQEAAVAGDAIAAALVDEYMATLGDSALYDRDQFAAVMSEQFQNPTQGIDDTLFNQGFRFRSFDSMNNRELVRYDQIGGAAAFILQRQEDIRRIEENRLRINERSLDAMRDQANYYTDNLQKSQALVEAEAERLHMLEVNDAMERSLQSAADLQNLYNGSMQEINGVQIATQGAADEAQRLAEEAADAYEEAKRLGLEGAELEGFATARDEAREMADELGRAADNLEGMSLDALLGATDGGRLGELADLIEAANEARGGAEAAGAFAAQADLATGRETEATLAVDEAANAIATLPVEDQIIAMQNLNAALDNLALNGVNVSTLGAEDMIGLAGLQAQDDGGFALGESEPFMPGGEISELETRSSLLEGIRENMGIMSETVAPDFSSAAMGLDSSVEQANSLGDRLAAIAATTYRVKVIYDIETNGMIPPGAGDPTTQVSISSGEV